MDLLTYFRILRRRWFLILFCMILGAGLGVASTLLKGTTVKSRTYYKATNSQIFDNAATTSVPSSVTNLDQIAILVTTGDVPDRVAKELGTGESGRQLAERIVTSTNAVTSTIDVTAVGRTESEATKLADAFAEQIGVSLNARDVARYDKSQASLNQQLNDLKLQADGFLAQLNQVPRPPDFDTIQKQYDATQNQYYSVYGQLQALTSAGAPASRLSTLESAEAVPIGADEYQNRLNLGALGENHLRADNTGGATTAVLSAPKDSLFAGRTSRGVLGAFLGFLVGVGIALVADRLDNRIRSRQDAEEAFLLPVLAEVPKFSRSQSRETELVAYSDPRSRASEAYRAIRTSLLFQQASGLGADRGGVAENGDDIFEPRVAGPHAPLVLMVTSAAPREGKTTTSANLAAIFAEAGSTVLVVNCDFRRPTIHRRFGVEDLPRRVQDTQVANVKIVTNVLGDPNANPAEVVAAQRQVIAAARKRFNVIILDTAPLLTANDAIEAVGSADLVLLVARSDMTTGDKAQRSMEMLTRLEAPLGGVVLVATADAHNDYYYYYQRGRRGRADAPPVAVNGNGNGNGTGRPRDRGAEMFPAAPRGDPPPG